MKTGICQTCTYYLQHYTFSEKRIIRVHCGHCTYARAKTKRPDANACEHYRPAEIGENPFVNKEYLSKALLDYVLNLELLPQICEAGRLL
jgi:hypothetical protein